MIAERIPNKADMYGRYRAGQFGGGPRQLVGWDTIEANWPTVPVVIRYMEAGKVLPRIGEALEPVKVRGIGMNELQRVCVSWLTLGADPAKIVASPLVPTHWTTLQGEVMRSPAYLSLRYTQDDSPMKEAFQRDNRHAEGLEALSLVRSAMDGRSLDWLEHLLDRFDGSVVEFTSYTRPVTQDGRNTIFWECRHY